MSDLHMRLTVASQIVTNAAQLASTLFNQRDTLAVEEKGPQDLVSAADRQVEQLIRQQLDRLLPGETIQGEEYGGEADGAFWSIDPIDGTGNYLRGSPLWGVSLGYVVDGQPLLGAIAYPQLNISLSAARGLGAWRNGAPLPRHVPCPALRVAAVGGNPRWDADRLNQLARALHDADWGVAQYRCATVSLGFSALGFIDGYIERHTNMWDIAAGMAICAEAGLTCTLGGRAEPGEMHLAVGTPELTQLAAPFIQP